MSIETLKQEFNVTTRYIHFPLHPDTPDEGISIQKLFAPLYAVIVARKREPNGIDGLCFEVAANAAGAGCCSSA